MVSYTVPGMKNDAAERVIKLLQDMLIEQSAQLEQFHWLIRAHLEAPDGSLATGSARTEKAAAKRVTRKR